MPQRATTTSFRKGQSGNPKGKPPMTPEKREFKEAFIQLLPKAWQHMCPMLKSTRGLRGAALCGADGDGPVLR